MIISKTFENQKQIWKAEAEYGKEVPAKDVLGVRIGGKCRAMRNKENIGRVRTRGTWMILERTKMR